MGQRLSKPYSTWEAGPKEPFGICGPRHFPSPDLSESVLLLPLGITGQSSSSSIRCVCSCDGSYGGAHVRRGVGGGSSVCFVFI